MKDYFTPRQEKFMPLLSKFIDFNEKRYEIKYEIISVEKAAKLDYYSYNQENYSSFFEMRSMIDCIPFTIWHNNELIYDSLQNNKSLDFLFVKTIYDELKKQFSLNEEEALNFINDCNNFFSENGKNKMPYELLLAKNIFEGSVKLNLSDFENMEIKKYEKIQIALSILKKQVESQEID